MIKKLNYGTDDLDTKSIKKKIALKAEEGLDPIKPLTAPKYSLGAAPLAPDATEPDMASIKEQIAINKPAIEVSNYGEKEISDITEDIEVKDQVKKLKTKKGVEAESSDFVGAGMKTLDFGITAAQKTEAMGRKERNAQTMGLVGKGASMGAAVGSVIPGVGTLIGAGAGAIAGLGTGLLKAKKSKKLENKRIQEERDKDIENKIRTREEAQRMFDGEKNIQKRQAILQGQQNILKAKY